MDTNTDILAITSVIVSVVATIIGLINHRRLRSNCFGKKMEVSIDIDKTSPDAQTPLHIKIPVAK
jgi:hypothetical protein